MSELDFKRENNNPHEGNSHLPLENLKYLETKP